MSDNFISTKQKFISDAGGNYIKTTQEIPGDFLDDIKDRRSPERSGDMLHVARIPMAVVHEWLKEGFDIFRASPREIVAKLKQKDLGAFLATDKRV